MANVELFMCRILDSALEKFDVCPSPKFNIAGKYCDTSTQELFTSEV